MSGSVPGRLSDISGRRLAFVLTFTGFGLFAGAVIAVLLAAGVVRHARGANIGDLARGSGVAAIVAGWVAFSERYIFHAGGRRVPVSVDAVDGLPALRRADAHPSDLACRGQAPHYRMGISLAIVVAAAAARIAWVWVRRRRRRMTMCSSC